MSLISSMKNCLDKTFPYKAILSLFVFLISQSFSAQVDTLKIHYPKISKELLDLGELDQKFRKGLFSIYKGRPPAEVSNAIEAVDRYNVLKLQEIIDSIGWPTKSKVGNEASHAAWLITQHAVFNPPFMKQNLRLMEEALDKNEVEGVDYAYLYDRFQAVCNLEATKYGVVRNIPIFEEYAVESRRENIGFKESLSDYLNDKEYSPPTKQEYFLRQKQLKESYSKNILKANEFLKAEAFEKAHKHYNVAMSCNGYIKTEDIYNSAIASAMLNSPASNFETIQYLRSLAARGFNDIKKIESQEAFSNLRNNTLYLEIIKIIKKYNIN